MGRTADSSSSNGSTPIINTLFTAGEAIQRGDMVLVGADGKAYAAAYPTDNAFSQQMRPTVGGPQVVNGVLANIQAAAGSAIGAGSDQYDVVRLSNGNILIAYVDPTTQIPCFSILNQDGGLVVNQKSIVVAGTQASNMVSAVALAGGGFAIGFKMSTAGYIAVFDNAGNATVAPFIVEPNATIGYYRIAQLVNGNLVMASLHTTSIRVSIFTPAGASVKASAVVVSSSYGSSGDRSIGIAALTGGGFVIGYNSASSSSACTQWSQRFDSAGVAQGAANQVGGGASGSNAFVYIVAMTGGGYACASVGNGTGCYLCIYNATGTLQGAAIFLGRLNNEIYGNFCALAASPDGYVGIVYVHTTAGLMGAVYMADATPISAPHVIEAKGASASVTYNPDGSATVVAVVSDQSSWAKVYNMSSGLWPNSTFQSSWAAGQSFPRCVGLSVTSSKTTIPCYMLIVQGNGANSPIQVMTNFTVRQAMTLTGVCTVAAAKDATVAVQITGQAALRRSFTATWATNQQGANPPGQRMHAIGNVALLQGVQPTTPPAIN